MIGGGINSEIVDAVMAEDLMLEIGDHSDAAVTVEIAGIFVDVSRVTYDAARERIVLRLHPDDVDDAVRRIMRGRARRDPVDDRSAEKTQHETDLG